MTTHVTNEAPPAWLKHKLDRASSYDILSSMNLLQNMPIDISNVARQLDIRIIYVDSPGYDGAVTTSWQDACIWVELHLTRTRKRFVIAHLIGRIMLHTIGATYRTCAPDSFYGMGDVKLKYDDGRFSAAEITDAWLGRQASEFGAALLMPRFKVQSLMYHSTLTVEEMARAFDVSVTAMGGRLNHIRSGREDR